MNQELAFHCGTCGAQNYQIVLIDRKMVNTALMDENKELREQVKSLMNHIQVPKKERK